MLLLVLWATSQQNMHHLMSVTFFVDDIWKEIDWKTIGIPVGSAHHEGCKVLLTTRSEEVCIRMNCQEKIKLSILSEDEAWDLFKDKADLKDYASLQPGIIDVAKEVARECKGLPLAIVIVGKSLKIYKSPGEWRAALERLKDSTHLDDGDDFEEIYSCLQLSYDFLKVKNIQSCFLLCSLFPEDADIDVEELIICGIGQGLYSNIYSIDDKRREIRVALTKLQKCGLLMESHRIDQSCVRMHDVVRDFAHWITLRGGNKFLVEDGLAELVSASPMIESFRVCTVIALWNTKIKSLPDKLEFSELKILILEEEAKGEISVLVPHKINKEDNSLSIPSTFFERMNALQVLLLRNVTFSLDALQFLPHLRALRLSSCKLINNISSLGGHEKMLNKLEILLLADTVIEELPEGLVELCTSLKSLLLRGRGYCNISPNLLSRLSSLEEIFVPVRNNVNLLELNSLSHVTALTLSIYTTNNVECFEESFVFPKLQRYSIFVNENVNCWSSYSRMLEIRDFSYSLRAFKELCCNMEVLVLNNVEKLRSLEDLVDTTPTPNGFLQELKELRIEKCRRLRWVYQVNEKRHDETRLIFPQLQRLHISECDGLEQVFDFAKETPFWLEAPAAAVLSKLINLELSSLPELKSIWRPTHSALNLQSLTRMSIRRCDKLSCVFWPSLAQTLVHLKELKIGECEFLEHIIIEKQNGDETVSNMHAQQGFPLCWPKLKTLEIIDCPQLMQVNVAKERGEEDIVLPQLEVLTLKCCPLLTRFLIKQGVPLKLHLEDVGVLSAFKEYISNAKLNLTLGRQTIHKKNLVPNVDSRGLNELNFLKLEDCEELECLVDTRSNEGGHVSTTVALSNLVELVIRTMPGLRMLCKGQCPKQFLQKLDKLEIENCREMTSLLISPEVRVTDSGNFISLQSLRVLKISNCGRLKYLFSPSIAQSLVLLEQLYIDHCDALQHIILTGLENDGHHHPPLKQVFNVAQGIDCAIVLPQLKHLYLRWLSNLSSFCSENYLILLPSLKLLRVWACPRLIDFTIHKQVNEQAQLKEMYLGDLGNDIVCDTINFPSTPSTSSVNWECITVANCEKIFQIRASGAAHFLSRVKGIGLDNIHHLQGPIQIPALQYLKDLHVSDCNRLKCLFSAVLARNLPQLSELRITDCEELEEIFEMDQTLASSSSSHAHLHPISLPSLQCIEIYGCNKLTRLFPLSVIHSAASKLQSIKIYWASKVEIILWHYGELDHDINEITLPQLEQFRLFELPSLKTLNPTGYHLLLPTLEDLEVRGCPQLTTCFVRDNSQRVWHTKTQTPQEGGSDNQPTCNDVYWCEGDSDNEEL